MSELTKAAAQARGRDVLNTEIAALEQVRDRIDRSFAEAIDVILASKGNVILTGIGKALIIAQKISASMASTGTPSIAVHPVDALHGDLGRVRKGDIIIALSASGESLETIDFVTGIQHAEVTRIAITCHAGSPLAKASDIVIDLGPLEEACPIGIAPSTTSVAMLAIGDALTLGLLELRGLTAEILGKLHPKGSIGRGLQTVEQTMRPLERAAVVHPDASVLDTLEAISAKRAGAACIVDGDNKLVGIFTDGDLRRLLAREPDCLGDWVEGHMTKDAKRVVKGSATKAAAELMHEHMIDELPVVDDDESLLGVIDIQDLR